jgi:hypothetical protein
MRTRVLDQTEVDRLHHEGRLTQAEHAIAERLRRDLWQIRVYGRMTSDVEPRPTGGETAPISRVQAEAMVRVNEAIRRLDREAGERARRLFINVMVDNRRVAPAEVAVVKQCLRALAEDWTRPRRALRRLAWRALGLARRY